MPGPRSAEQEAKAREFASELAQIAEEEFLEIAHTLLDAEPATLFGATEFKLRDLGHKVVAKAYERRLAQKNSATTPPV